MTRHASLPDAVWLALRDRLAAATLTEAERLDGPALDHARLVINAILADFGVIQASYASLAALLEKMRQQAEADRLNRDLVLRHIEQMTGGNSSGTERVIHLGGAKDEGEGEQ